MEKLSLRALLGENCKFWYYDPLIIISNILFSNCIFEKRTSQAYSAMLEGTNHGFTKNLKI